MIANRPVVWTLLARAMSVADRELAQALNPGEQVIYVVSDGEEACGGDPFAAARRINKGTARAIVNIIGFGLSHNEATSLQTVAGAGTFVNLETKRDFDKTVAAVKESIRLAGNEVRASNAISANAVTTASVISKASLCISNIISSESNRVRKIFLNNWPRDGRFPRDFSTNRTGVVPSLSIAASLRRCEP